ncbi:hypothetical protein GJA_4432 [Janthinobacterium agaricidamnosum NBRC 102515 = DSM 9628]|uniref:Uncharacterized protein n=1 Tax=Janthinobacterium agaricidamnosum NBRC 102515 = DSM 9628 TaxID=1349767 RepID=W0V895_9BURK|nr:hypothetical protein GJA_4432 [Janthinobacterium agaricidamnosum NBRC 102515 = DSM 9628]
MLSFNIILLLSRSHPGVPHRISLLTVLWSLYYKKQISLFPCYRFPMKQFQATWAHL